LTLDLLKLEGGTGRDAKWAEFLRGIRILGLLVDVLDHQAKKGCASVLTVVGAMISLERIADKFGDETACNIRFGRKAILCLETL
jgi:hypothetical protein